MSTPVRDCPAPLCLSRAEAWAVHAALLAHLEREWEGGTPPTFANELRERVEASDGPLDFDVPALRYVRARLDDYLDEAPPRDRPHVRTVLDSIEAALQSSPSQ